MDNPCFYNIRNICHFYLVFPKCCKITGDLCSDLLSNQQKKVIHTSPIDNYSMLKTIFLMLYLTTVRLLYDLCMTAVRPLYDFSTSCVRPLFGHCTTSAQVLYAFCMSSVRLLYDLCTTSVKLVYDFFTTFA